MSHEDRGKVRITKMICGGCGKPLKPFEKGRECKYCETWPLCDACADKHESPESFCG